MSADKAPAEKLPLAIRKNVRDGWEAKKGELESQMETLLGGVKWTMTCNPLAIFPYGEPGDYGHDSLGNCIFAYFDSFIWSLKSFVKNHGDTGVTELNTVCPNHTVTLSASTKFTYSGAIVDDGNLNLVFHPKNLGSNIDHVGQKLAEALSVAPQPAGASTLSYVARHSIKTDFDTELPEMLEKARKALKNEAFKFEPSFEAVGQALKAGKDVRDDWESTLGAFAKNYFDGFLDILKREKFIDDEMLREGFEEGVPKGVVKLRVVDKLKSGNGYNETIIEDGEAIIQTTPGNWGTNMDHACTKLVDIL